MSQVNLSFHLGSDQTISVHSPSPVKNIRDKNVDSDDSLINTNMSRIEDRISGIRGTFQQNNFMSQSENLQFQDKLCCIEPLCFERNKVYSSDEAKEHKGHLSITLSQILKKLTVLKCNSRLGQDHPQRTAVIFEGMDRIFNEIVEIQAQILQLFSKIKIQTLRHISEVKKSFSVAHFQLTKNKIINEFNPSNVQSILNEISNYQKYRYPDLDYPHFKVNLVQKRINTLNKAYKDKFTAELKSFIARYCGDNSEHSRTKKESRSTTSFLQKNVSEQPIFSYYLRSNEYLVSHSGKRLKRTDITTELPLAVIQKRVDQNPIKIKINKSCPQGIVIGFSPLSCIQKTNFQNTQNNGYFLYNKGVVLSQKSRYKNAFRYSQNDIVSVRIEKGKLLFNKIREESVVEGFSIEMSQLKKHYSANQKFYVSVLLGSQVAEVQIVD